MGETRRQTEQLLQYLDACHKRFLKGKKPERDRSFFEMVKKETNPIFALLNEWEKNVLGLIDQSLTTLYPQQIHATTENMQAVIIQSYYKDIRKRRFIESYKSCYYIFRQLVKELAG